MRLSLSKKRKDYLFGPGGMDFGLDQTRLPFFIHCFDCSFGFRHVEADPTSSMVTLLSSSAIEWRPTMPKKSSRVHTLSSLVSTLGISLADFLLGASHQAGCSGRLNTQS
jgi:hypothetical protein